MARAVAVAAQLVALVLLNELGYALAGVLPIPLPGNLVGMLMLLALLVTGVVPIRWAEPTATLLTRHLAFFFIPIAVGLIAFAAVLADHGAAILVTLVVSAGVGISAAGLTAQGLAFRTGRKSSWTPSDTSASPASASPSPSPRTSSAG